MQAVYLGLALLMGLGLVLFGVGAGNGLGGLLNAFTGNGSSSAQTQVVSAQEKAALRQTKLNPSDPAAWAALVQARWTSAGQGNNFNTTTGQFTANGRKELTATTQAWQKYAALTKNPDPSIAILAARAYGNLGNYAQEAAAWETMTIAQPTEPKGYECLAASAYAAKQNRKGDLALQKVLTLVPKAQQATLKAQITAAKTSPQIAQAC